MDKNKTQRSEKNEEENHIKQERQKQLQQNKQTEGSNDKQHYGYPYYPRPKPQNPVVSPPVYRPVLAAR